MNTHLIDSLSPIIYPFGETAWVIESCHAKGPTYDSDQILDEQKVFWQLKESIDGLSIKGIKESVLGQRNLTVIFDPFLISDEEIRALLNNIWSQCLKRYKQQYRGESSPKKSASAALKLPIYFGGQYGPDLEPLASSLNMSCEYFVQQYCRPLYTVLFLGFQPGFAYLHGLPKALKAPRLANPRTQIPAGSLAIGGGQTGIYPSNSPGGWQIIGRISDAFMPLFDPSAHPPTRLKAGDILHFLPQTHTGSISH